jgi:hypothetical protein
VDKKKPGIQAWMDLILIFVYTPLFFKPFIRKYWNFYFSAWGIVLFPTEMPINPPLMP